jgi:hypothetical protein
METVNYYNRLKIMIEIVEVDCYFVVFNFNGIINENFVGYLYFMLFTK